MQSLVSNADDDHEHRQQAFRAEAYHLSGLHYSRWVSVVAWSRLGALEEQGREKDQDREPDLQAGLCSVGLVGVEAEEVVAEEGEDGVGEQCWVLLAGVDEGVQVGHPRWIHGRR